MLHKKLRLLPLAFVPALLTSCDLAVIDTKGIIAHQQASLIITTLLLMLIVVIPVIVLTFVFAYKYRASNTKAKYTPDWAHNARLEVIWWTIPIVIILILAVITWRSSHSLDPYKPLESPVKPIEIEVIALDWKWLFIYPEQDIAAVNLVKFPVGVPVNFKITAQAPMNSFWIPRLAGQIYAMEGMRTLLHVMADEPGDFPGLSSNFSGRGFSEMNFTAQATTQEDFDTWVKSVKKTSNPLTVAIYDQLAKQSENEPVTLYSSIPENLSMDVMMRYMDPNCSKHKNISEIVPAEIAPAAAPAQEHEHCSGHTEE